jgi:cell wall assembly regulator SMI1
MLATWQKLERWLEEHAAHLLDELNPGALPADIANLEKAIGTPLPSAFRDFYKVHNGQEPGEGLVETEELLSTERILEEWRVWKDLLDNGNFHGTHSEPEEGVKNDWWNPLWIPITYDGSGNHYCIDLDPAPGGRKGQIIRMWHDAPERPIIADSFHAWIDDYIGQLIKGEYIYSAEWGGIIHREDL